jgi:hypothetical protein
MQKLKLSLDELEVASFEPGAGREERGTVQARELAPHRPVLLVRGRLPDPPLRHEPLLSRGRAARES